MTSGGILLLGIGLLVSASGFEWARVPVGGLWVHPYLLLLPVALLIAIAQRRGIPGPLAFWFAAFTGWYFVACMLEPDGLGEFVKLATAMLTVAAVAVCVRTEEDFLAGTLGLTVAVALLAFIGLQGDVEAGRGVNPMEGVANKNAYSLYGIPAVHLALFGITQRRPPLSLRAVLLGSVLLISLVVFVGGNRSGWLGLLVSAALMLTRGRRVRTVLAVTLVAGATWFALNEFLSTEIFERRLHQTVEGYQSDQLRKELVRSAFEIALENPLTGVAPQRLGLYLARDLPVPGQMIDPHNVFGHLAGGTGLTGLLLLLLLGVALWRVAPISGPGARDGAWLLRTLLVLWVVRGMFSREILYSPGFTIGLGLALGLTLLDQPRPSTPERKR